MTFESGYAFAKKCDLVDPLKEYRSRFNLPHKNGNPYIYLCGNSLGLQPKEAVLAIQKELQVWQSTGIEGYFEGDAPWVDYNDTLSSQMAKVVGAKAQEVVVMNTLTINLHLMMVSFYRPSSKRYKILIESDAFPSDRYVVESQLQLHGYDPSDAMITVTPQADNDCLKLEDISSVIEEHGGEIALVLIGNSNYYTGQVHDMYSITKVAHAHGCKIGFDCAHGAGNVPLNLNEAGVDFAVWCTYKYLNSGPGSIGACYINERHLDNHDIPKLKGWWGHHRDTRFGMREEFEPAPGALSWQVSCPPILAITTIIASLNMFSEVGMDSLREKSIKLTGYLEFLINNLKEERIKIITPSDPKQRGCQLSLKLSNSSKKLYDNLISNGVILDWREPDVIRVAPAPLYNTYDEVYRFVQILESQLYCS